VFVGDKKTIEIAGLFCCRSGAYFFGIRDAVNELPL
jgi:hypothetical protein